MLVTRERQCEIDRICQQMAAQLAVQGWCVRANFLPADVMLAMREKALENWREGNFRHAGIGRNETFQIKPQIRNDRVLWLDQQSQDAGLSDYFNSIETLRLAINQQLYLGLFDFEAHFAIYPPGSFYKKHLDQFKGIGLRTVTTTFYLNDDWHAQQGGQLRIYHNVDQTPDFTDILPEGGTLVVFLSADYLHEVLPATRERLSITGWFRRRL